MSDDHDSARRVAETLDALARRHRGDRTPALSYAFVTTRGFFAQGAVGVADLEHRTPACAADQFPWPFHDFFTAVVAVLAKNDQLTPLMPRGWPSGQPREGHRGRTGSHLPAGTSPS